MNGASRWSAPQAAAARYILGRQCRGGGFCFYRNEHLEEPNLSDTWYALAGLALLGQEIPGAPLHSAWLDRVDPCTLHPEALHDWAFARRMLDARWQPDAATLRHLAAMPWQAPELAHQAPSPALVRSLLHTGRLRTAFLGAETAPWIADWLRSWHRGGYGSKPNLEDTALALELLATAGTPDRSAATRAFVETMQSATLGFTNTVDSRYCRLSILLAGVQCCGWLGLPLRHPEPVMATLLAAQRDDGAFADVPGALPNLETHHHALQLLTQLQALRSTSDAGF